jgi:hypothetical protein
MSVSELAIQITKQPGTAIGFTLIKDSCTVGKIIDPGIARELVPGDVILSIDGIEVNVSSIRNMLRDCRNSEKVFVTVARTNMSRYVEQENALVSPLASSGGCFCFSKKAPPRESRALQPRNSSNHTESLPGTHKRTGSIGSASSPKNFGSVSSLSSAGMRPLDLRKLTKEGAGTMWMVGRGNSANR